MEPAGSAPAGRVPDVGGPELRALPELARVRADVRGLRRRILPLRLPGRVFAGYRAEHHLVPGPAYGRITFEEHLARRRRG